MRDFYETNTEQKGFPEAPNRLGVDMRLGIDKPTLT